jgi:hypothetical protein
MIEPTNMKDRCSEDLYDEICREIRQVLLRPTIRHGQFTLSIIFREGNPDRYTATREVSRKVS